jgi:hypothetical protein
MFVSWHSAKPYSIKVAFDEGRGDTCCMPLVSVNQKFTLDKYHFFLVSNLGTRQRLSLPSIISLQSVFLKFTVCGLFAEYILENTWQNWLLPSTKKCDTRQRLKNSAKKRFPVVCSVPTVVG